MLLKSFLVITIVVAALTPVASASVIYSIVPITPVAMPGDTNDAFEVLLTNTGGSVSVGGFTFGVTTANAAITFVSADMSTPAPYIFAGNSFDADNSFSLNTSSGSSLLASDETNDFTGVTVASGQSFALGRVLYDVTPGAAVGSFTITFTGTSGDNSLTDPSGAPITINIFQSDQVPIESTPEPGSVLLVPAGLLVLLRLRSARAGKRAGALAPDSVV